MSFDNLRNANYTIFTPFYQLSEHEQPQTYRKMTTTQNIIQQENGAGDAIIRENLETLSILPNKYHFPAASEYILESVSTGRADGLKEAMLQTEEQIHRWNIEAGYSAMMQQMAEMNKRLSDIEWRVWTAPAF